jgi:hypothetical protein
MKAHLLICTMLVAIHGCPIAAAANGPAGSADNPESLTAPGEVKSEPRPRRPNVQVLLDTDLPEAARSTELSKLIESAEAGNRQDQYLLGTLYRLGREHPSKVMDQDLGKAEIYLSNAATHGVLNAMAGMAEMELSRNRPLQAMIWTQAYIHYKEVAQKKFALPDDRKKEYQASLLSRCLDALDRHFDLDSIKPDYGRFLTQYDGTIKEGLGFDVPTQLKPTQSKPALELKGIVYIYVRDRKSAAEMELLLGVDADGRVAKCFVLDILPNAQAATFLKPEEMRDHLFFSEAQKGEPLRWGVQRIIYEAGALRLDE